MKGLTIERIKMHQDARGKLFEPLGPKMLGSGVLRNVHVATMAPGSIRGSHRHQSATEYFCFSGDIKFIVRDQKGACEELDFNRDECVRVTVAPGIAHALVNIGQGDAFFICFSDRLAGTDPQEKIHLVSA